jgi:curved DNA-binding protein
LFKYGLKKIFGVELPERGKDIRDGITLPLELAASGGRIKYSSKKVSKELLVKIPPGIKEGQHIRLKGLGKKGKGSGEPGDLLVKIRVRKPLFYRIAALFRKSKR